MTMLDGSQSVTRILARDTMGTRGCRTIISRFHRWAQTYAMSVYYSPHFGSTWLWSRRRAGSRLDADYSPNSEFSPPCVRLKPEAQAKSAAKTAFACASGFNGHQWRDQGSMTRPPHTMTVCPVMK